MLSERERLLTLLFERSDGKKLVNIKFFQGVGHSLTVETMAAAARRVVEQVWRKDQVLSDAPPDAHLPFSATVRKQ